MNPSNDYGKKPNVRISPFAQEFFYVRNFWKEAAVNVFLMIKRNGSGFERKIHEKILLSTLGSNGNPYPLSCDFTTIGSVRVNETCRKRAMTCVAVWENPITDELDYDVCVISSESRYGLWKWDSPTLSDWDSSALMSAEDYVKFVKFVSLANSGKSGKKISSEDVCDFLKRL